MKKSGIVILIVIGVATIVGWSSAFTVHQTQQALVLQFGNPVRPVENPGLNFKMPFIQNVRFFDKRILDLDPQPTEILLADQKRINVDSFARYKIVDPLEFPVSYTHLTLPTTPYV